MQPSYLPERKIHTRTAVCVVCARTAVCVVCARNAVCACVCSRTACVCVCVCVNCATHLPGACSEKSTHARTVGVCRVCVRTVCVRELCNRVICLSENSTPARTAMCVVCARTAVCVVCARTVVCVVCARTAVWTGVCSRVCVNCATELFA